MYGSGGAIAHPRYLLLKPFGVFVEDVVAQVHYRAHFLRPLDVQLRDNKGKIQQISFGTSVMARIARMRVPTIIQGGRILGKQNEK